jgi:hypothetical protein
LLALSIPIASVSAAWSNRETASVFLQHRQSLELTLFRQSCRNMQQILPNVWAMTLLGTACVWSSERTTHVPRNLYFTCVSLHAAGTIGDTENKPRARFCSSAHHTSRLAATPQHQHGLPDHQMATPRPEWVSGPGLSSDLRRMVWIKRTCV